MAPDTAKADQADTRWDYLSDFADGGIIGNCRAAPMFQHYAQATWPMTKQAHHQGGSTPVDGLVGMALYRDVPLRPTASSPLYPAIILMTCALLPKRW